MALYDAFVSYSHAKDKPIAAALQSVIQTLGKPWYRRRALRVFRDDTGLAATPSLWDTIEQALGQSRYLILLASPDAAASPWVNKEVAHWLDHKSVDTLLIAVTEGTLAWDNAIGDFIWREGMPLPPVLTRRFASEPKWVDLTAYRDGADPSDAKFTELAADFASAIHGMPKEDLLSQEVRQQRRALRLAWSAAGSLLILALAAGGAGVLAYRAQQQAIVERDTATRNFKLALKAADSLVLDIAQGLRHARGMNADTVHKILETAKGTLEQLAVAAPDDLRLQESRGQMLDEFGQTYITLGDLEEALKAYRESLAIGERVAAADPSNTRLQHNLSVPLYWIGYVLETQGKLEEALKAYRDGLAIGERIAAIDPNSTQWQRDLSSSYKMVGNVLMAQGKLEEALKLQRHSLAIAERLAAGDPSNTEWQRDLSISYGNVGGVLLAQGKDEEALKAYREHLAIAERLAAINPDNTQWQRDLSIAYNQIGDVLLAQGKHDEALKTYRDGLAIAERLAAADPNNTQWQNDLSASYGNVGDVLAALSTSLSDPEGKLEEALKAYRESLAIRKRLAAADPSNKQWQHDLIRSYGRIGNVLQSHNRLDEALKAYRDGSAIAERLATADPGNAQWRRNLSISYEMIGKVLAAQDKGEEALAAYGDSLAIRERLAAANPGNTRWQSDLSISYDDVGEVLVMLGKLEEALKAFRDSLAIRERLVAADHGNAEWQHEFEGSIFRIDYLAYRFVVTRDFARALDAADQAIAPAPDHVWLYANRAHALMFLGRIEEARALYLQYRGKKNVKDDESWETFVLTNFANLRQEGLTHTLMDEIETKFAAHG